jgi:hypothetical protein
MTSEEAMERISAVLAHAWMVRYFLRHVEEAADDEDMAEVHRVIFDSVRALEPSYQRKDAAEFLRRARGKLPKLRRAAELFAREQPRISDHTNFQMAVQSLVACVAEIDRLLSAAGSTPGPRTSPERAAASAPPASPPGPPPPPTPPAAAP